MAIFCIVETKNIIATCINMGGNNLNVNIVLHGNVDVHWMANVCKHWKSSCVLRCNDVATYIGMHGNNICLTKAQLKIKIRL